MGFQLHDRLVADTRELARWTLCRVLLMTDSQYPWLILVPEREGARELHDLSPSDQCQLMAEISQASRALETVFLPDKLNVGALGNMVQQLHVHVIARYESDPAWPGPVWGAVPAKPYGAGELEAVAERILGAFAETG